MKISLFYRGPLKSNADARVKHELRKYFHPQLRRAIEQSPEFIRRKRNWPDGDIFVAFADDNTQTVGTHDFLALAAPHLIPPSTEWRYDSSVELDIVMLRAGPMGSLVTGGGDIDNRLKTLFDALQIPDENQAVNLTTNDIPESPMLCLMSDDKLITSVNVSTAQLLDVEDQSKEVVLIINVTIHNSGLN